MTVFVVDPLLDPRWPDLVARHSNATIFHSTNWLCALRNSYNYVPVVYTTSPPDKEMTDGIVFCRVRSWFTGSRLVSLPFSDHCQPLVSSTQALNAIVAEAIGEVNRSSQKYLEIRPLEYVFSDNDNLSSSDNFLFHSIDLTKNLEDIYAHFHTTSVKQMIKRADREHLAYSEGRDEHHLDIFYKLLLLTRQKHQIPPQPRNWFANILNCLGDAAKIRIALKNDVPVASILTISHKQTHYYKYGCSDSKFSKMGGTQMLLWRAIQDAKNSGATVFDMGRSDPHNRGLVEFKERWGSQQNEIHYYRYPPVRNTSGGKGMKIAKSVFKCVPAKLQETIGSLIYRHIG